MKITLDAGHTKNYNNGIIDGYYEGNMNFALSLYLKSELEKYDNVTVYLTKSKIEENPDLKARGKTAIDNGSDIFISIHSNALQNADRSYNTTAKGVVGYYSIKKPESKELLELLLNGIAKAMGSYSRGALTRKGDNGDWYSVIRNSICDNIKASFLIEHGFHTNPDECKWLKDNDNLKKLAECEAEIIAKYYGLILKSVAENNAPKIIYRVQVGAFTNKQNADYLLSKLRAKGFTGFIVTENK